MSSTPLDFTPLLPDGLPPGAARWTGRAKLVTLMESLKEHFGEAAEFDDPKGGIFLWVKLPDGEEFGVPR